MIKTLSIQHIFLSSILCSAIWLAGCSGMTKDEHVINVTITEKGTMAPKPFARVGLIQLNNKGTFNAATLTDGGNADANGQFQFMVQPFKNKKASDIRTDVQVETSNTVRAATVLDPLTIGSVLIPFEDVLANEVYDLNISTNPYGFIEILPKGVVEDAGFSLLVRIEGTSFVHQTLLAKEDVEKSFKYPVFEENDVRISWLIQSPVMGTSESFADSVNTIVNDTLRYIIQL